MDEFVEGGVGDIIADILRSRYAFMASKGGLYVALMRGLQFRGQALSLV